jgi:hypothetical protein
MFVLLCRGNFSVGAEETVGVGGGGWREELGPLNCLILSKEEEVGAIVIIRQCCGSRITLMRIRTRS